MKCGSRFGSWLLVDAISVEACQQFVDIGKDGFDRQLARPQGAQADTEKLPEDQPVAAHVMADSGLQGNAPPLCEPLIQKN